MRKSLLSKNERCNHGVCGYHIGQGEYRFGTCRRRRQFDQEFGCELVIENRSCYVSFEPFLSDTIVNCGDSTIYQQSGLFKLIIHYFSTLWPTIARRYETRKLSNKHKFSLYFENNILKSKLIVSFIIRYIYCKYFLLSY